MEYARPIMWNVPHWAEITLYVMIPIVLATFAGIAYWRARKWFLGRAEPGVENVRRLLLAAIHPRRLVQWTPAALFQSRLSPDVFALVMHWAIFWGMAVLFLGTALATIDQDFLNLPLDVQMLRGKFYCLFELGLDVFGVVLLLGLAMAAYRRYLVRPKRLQATRAGVSLWDGFPFLATIALVAVTGFVAEGLRIAEGFHIEAQVAEAEGLEAKVRVLDEMGFREHSHLSRQRQDAQVDRIVGGGPVFPAAIWAPVGYVLAKALEPLPVNTIRLLHQGVWWAHGLLAFGLIVCIPLTKAFHLISSPANMLLRSADPPGRLPVAVESGITSVRDCTWRQLLQVEACTWCGKCQEVCPANECGFPLSPRDLVQAVDSQLLRTPAKSNGDLPSLHDGRVRAEELWACYSCRACEEVCPVFVQHPRLIVDLRRRLVDQGQVDEGLQDALMNFQRYGNSFGQSPRKRPDWTKPLEFKLKDARKEEVEYLWFVGDYASYDQRAQEITRTVARVLHHAGVDVGLLMEKEQNAGNDVRRIGEEGLFAMLREKNAKELSGARFRKLLTTDPHTYNTLKNEYEDAPHPGDLPEGEGKAGERTPVLHYTELLDELLRAGDLRIDRKLDYTVTYHDPCYLGRFNGVYDAPRRVLAGLGGRLVEMPRHGPNSFCCGAGGGRIWMKDAPTNQERPAENRVREALALGGVQCMVVACPKDFVMFQDAVKTVGAEGRLRVVDLGELVLESMAVAASLPNEVVESKA